MENLDKTMFFGQNVIRKLHPEESYNVSIKKKFKEEGVVVLKDFFTDYTMQKIQLSVESEYYQRVRRNFFMEPYGSARKMSVIGGSSIVDNNITLMKLYSNQALRSAIESIVGEPIHTVSHQEEFMVVNFLDESGDTHGWHLDDPKYALVVIIETPVGGGGDLEFISHWKENYGKISQQSSFEMAVEEARSNNDIKSVPLNSGDCYLIDAGNSLHRVTPIKGKGKRKALNMAFDDRRYQLFGDTATLLYGDS